MVMTVRTYIMALGINLSYNGLSPGYIPAKKKETGLYVVFSQEV
jgi:hypothetical protein